MLTAPEVASSSVRVRTAMQPFFWVCALILAGVAAVWPVVPALTRIWGGAAEYEHGPAIVAIVAVWLISLRGRINAVDLAARPLVLPALALVLALWLVAYRANSELMQQILAPAVMQLAILAALGPGAFRIVFLPLTYLYFAIPVWDQLLPLLQSLTTYVAESLLGALGVPTSVEGHHVTIPEGRFVVAEGCSGKRYIIVGLATAVAAGAMQRLQARRFLLLLAVAVVSALIINWVRVVVIIYAGHATNMQHYFVATEHFSLGYALFAPLLIAIIVSARALGRESTEEATPAPRGAVVRAPAPGLLGSFAMLASPVIVAMTTPSFHDAHPMLAPLPVLTGNWQGPLPPAARGWRPEFAGHVDEKRASYSSEGFRVDLYMNSYGLQTQGRELVYHANSVAPADGWSLVRKLRGSWDAPTMVVAEDSASRRWVIAHIYSIGGRVTSSPGLTQFYYGAHAIWRPVPAGLIALAAPCDRDCETSAQRVTQLWEEHGDEFVALIPRKLVALSGQ